MRRTYSFAIGRANTDQAPTATVDRTATTSIRLCGKFSVIVHGRDVTGAVGHKQGRAVLACLLLKGEAGASRDELIHVLWPDRAHSPGAPERGLAVVISRLRTALETADIAGPPQLSIRLEPGAAVDVEVARRGLREAEQALAAGEFARARAAVDAAMAGCNGPLLPGLEGEWVDDERRRVDELKLRLRRAGIQAGIELGGPELDRVVEEATHLVEEEPTSETAVALLMRALAARGDRSDALTAYDTLCTRLLDEIGAPPSPTLAALHAELLRDEPAPPRAVPAPARPRSDRPFVGRETELELLRDRWVALDPERWPLVLLEGEPGIGKTALADRFASLGGKAVLDGRCDKDPIVPYQPFVEALGGHGLRFEPHEQATVPVEFQRYVMFDGVAQRLADLSRAQPQLLVIDDLQWADKPTVKLLQHLARRELRIMLVGTYRGAEIGHGHPLRELLTDQQRQHRLDIVRLGGLSRHETGALAETRIDEPAADLVNGLWELTSGNALYIEETLRSLAESADDDPPTARTLEDMHVSEGVQDVIELRLGVLGPEPLRALEAAAAIGHVFDLELVAGVSGLSLAEVIEALDAPAMGGLVEELHEYRFAFAHAIVRQAIYERLLGTRRAQLHQRIGSLLEEKPRSPGQAAAVAHHLTRGGGDPERIQRHEVRAGQEAARAFAYEEAAGHFERAAGALDLLGPEHERRRAEVLLWWAGVLSRAGRSRQAADKFRAAAVIARGRGDAEQLAVAALGVGQRYWEANINDPAYRAQLEEALERLAAVKATERVQLLSTRLSSRLAEHLAFVPGEDERARALSAEAVETARRLGDPDTLITALMGRHVALLHVEHVEERLALIEEVLDLRGSHRELAAEARQWRLYDLCELGRLDEARAEAQQLRERSRELQQPLFQHVAVAWEGVFAELAGDVAETERLTEESFALGTRAQAYDARSIRAAKLFALYRWQGQLDKLRGDVEGLGSGRTALAAWRAALALHKVLTDRYDDGRREAHVLATHFDRVPRDFFWLSAATVLAEAVHLCDDAEGAAVLYDALAPYASRHTQHSFAACWGSVERPLGLLADTLGRRDAAEAHLRAALAANCATRAPVLIAATECDLGQLLAGGDAADRERAAELGATAESRVRQLGLPVLAARAARLRA